MICITHTEYRNMGNSFSEEEKHSAPQQPKPVPIVEHDQAVPIQKCSTNSTLSPVARTSYNHHSERNAAQKGLPKLPHNCEAIVKDSDSPVDTSSQEKVYQQLHAGVFLEGRSKKYWVDKKGNNCFMIFAIGLKITWAENPTYWCLQTTNTSDQGQITIAQLLNVCWLDIHGKFHTSNLSTGVTYQVAFLIMLEYTSYGWDVPINLRLTLPNGSKQEHKEYFKEKPKGEWLRIPIGEIKVSPENDGEIEFSLYEIEAGNWKKGLVVKSVIIEPNY